MKNTQSGKDSMGSDEGLQPSKKGMAYKVRSEERNAKEACSEGEGVQPETTSSPNRESEANYKEDEIPLRWTPILGTLENVAERQAQDPYVQRLWSRATRKDVGNVRRAPSPLCNCTIGSEE